jgi:hypothetical protein
VCRGVESARLRAHRGIESARLRARRECAFESALFEVVEGAFEGAWVVSRGVESAHLKACGGCTFEGASRH